MVTLFPLSTRLRTVRFWFGFLFWKRDGISTPNENGAASSRTKMPSCIEQEADEFDNPIADELSSQSDLLP